MGGANYNSSVTYGTTALQMVDIRGWLSMINDPDKNMNGSNLFAFKINYNTTQFDGSPALYNGNISETAWRSKSDNKLRGYDYSYDSLNRITDAHYASSHRDRV